MGWLNAAPDTKGKIKKSRLALLETTGKDPELPDVGEASYLLNMFFELGAVLQTGVGATPTSWQEIQSWINLSGLHVDYWELLTLKEMSYAYASEYGQATDPQRPAPYIKEARKVDHARMASNWLNFVESHNKNFQRK